MRLDGGDSRSFHFNRTPTEGVASLLSHFPAGSFSSPFRSTVPLVSLVKDDWPAFQSLTEACGAQGELALHFEYQVAPPGVSGNASHTDVMIICSNAAIAIEAKWTEPRYETVTQRLRSRVATLVKSGRGGEEEHEAAQEAVIQSWLSELGSAAGKRLSIEAADSVVYQMIHRAASVCSISKQPRMVYLHFEPCPARGASTGAQYRVDLEDLYALMGAPDDFPIFLVEIPLSPTHEFRAIESLPKGRLDTDRLVREAIASERLFTFDKPRVERIGFPRHAPTS